MRCNARGGVTGGCGRALLAALMFMLSAASVAEEQPLEHEFYFTRGVYQSTADGDAWGPRWAIDFPEADQHFLVALRRLTSVDAFPEDNTVPLERDAARRFPFIYLVEAGALDLDEEQNLKLREYLLSGGFLMIDDFWGTWAWDNLQVQLARLFPERQAVDIPPGHPIFHCFYDIEEILQVPNVALAGGPKTYEYDGKVPHVRGVFDDDGRLMVLINWNTDLGDAWEWADRSDYPLKYSNYAYQLGINAVIYAMSY